MLNESRIKATVWAAALAVVMASGAAQAALFDRGGGLIYDNVLNITWLADANYAHTSGYDSDGKMSWTQATSWAANLSYYDSVRDVAYDDWRLASATKMPSGWNYQYSYSSTGPRSELLYMYYVNLGFKGYASAEHNVNPDYGIFGNGTTGGARDGVGPNGSIINLQSNVYWSGTESTDYPPGFAAYMVYMFDGNSGIAEINHPLYPTSFYAWAVRDGDVAAATTVPEPENLALLLGGLSVIGAAIRHKKKG